MKIMAVDYGDSRTGLAISDETETLASPLETVYEHHFERCAERIAQIAAEKKAGMIIVGDPVNTNGTRGPRSEKCCEFARMLRELVGVEVIMWDERSSTVTAISYMNEINKRGKKRRQVIDQAAAAVILDNYLEYRKRHKDDPSDKKC